MADVTVSETHWYHLKKSANCFVPLLVQQNGDIKNTELHAMGPKGEKGFSVQSIGKVMRLEPVKHEKAQQCIQAYVAYQEAHTTLVAPPATPGHMIVAALFAIPNLA